MSAGGDAAIVQLAEHLATCTNTDAAIVVDGNGDDVVSTLIAAGWTYDGTVEYVAGKRIRHLTPPAGVFSEETTAQLAALRERRHHHAPKGQ